MRTWRTPRIGRSEADRLIAGQPTGPRHTGLAELLSAASAPADPSEWAGEWAAVEAFARARRDGAPAARPAPRHHRRVRLPGRTVTATVAAAAAVLVAGGAAAFTGPLPGAAERRAHSILASLGVAAPPARSRAPAGTAPDGRGATPSAGNQASDPPVLALCRSWAAGYLDRRGNQRQPPPGRALPAQALRALAAAAGSERDIPGYCAQIIAGHGHDQPEHPVPPGQATRSPDPGTPDGGQPHGTDSPGAHPSARPHRPTAPTGTPTPTSPP